VVLFAKQYDNELRVSVERPFASRARQVLCTVLLL
jgi:hypothetical protein